jgi:hypothetical protein
MQGYLANHGNSLSDEMVTRNSIKTENTLLAALEKSR